MLVSDIYVDGIGDGVRTSVSGDLHRDDLVGRSAEVDRERTEAKGNGKKVKQACTGDVLRSDAR